MGYLISAFITYALLSFLSLLFVFVYAENNNLDITFLQTDLKGPYDMLIEWLNDSAHVALLGIVGTFIAVFIEINHRKREKIIEELRYSKAYFEAIVNELQKTQFLIKESVKLQENEYKIYDGVFPNEAYDKLSIDKVDVKDERTKTSIIDFYNIVKLRNKKYIHRQEVKHRFIRTKNYDGWTDFINYVDFLIERDEAYLSKKTILCGLIAAVLLEKKDKENRISFEKKPFIKRRWNALIYSIREKPIETDLIFFE